jgi:hypothetical protein
VNDKYTEAIAQFEKYKLKRIGQRHKSRSRSSNCYLQKCYLALENKSAVAKITNIGAPVNTAWLRVHSCFSFKRKFYGFHLYRGERSMGGKQILPNKADEKNGIYFEDVMMSYKNQNNQWTEPTSYW